MVMRTGIFLLAFVVLGAPALAQISIDNGDVRVEVTGEPGDLVETISIREGSEWEWVLRNPAHPGVNLTGTLTELFFTGGFDEASVESGGREVVMVRTAGPLEVLRRIRIADDSWQVRITDQYRWSDPSATTSGYGPLFATPPAEQITTRFPLFAAESPAGRMLAVNQRMVGTPAMQADRAAVLVTQGFLNHRTIPGQLFLDRSGGNGWSSLMGVRQGAQRRPDDFVMDPRPVRNPGVATFQLVVELAPRSQVSELPHRLSVLAWNEIGAERFRKPLPQTVPTAFMGRIVYGFPANPGEVQTMREPQARMTWDGSLGGVDVSGMIDANYEVRFGATENALLAAFGFRYWGQELFQGQWIAAAERHNALIAFAPSEQGAFPTSFNAATRQWPPAGQRTYSVQAMAQTALLMLEHLESFSGAGALEGSTITPLAHAGAMTRKLDGLVSLILYIQEEDGAIPGFVNPNLDPTGARAPIQTALPSLFLQRYAKSPVMTNSVMRSVATVAADLSLEYLVERVVIPRQFAATDATDPVRGTRAMHTTSTGFLLGALTAGYVRTNDPTVRAAIPVVADELALLQNLSDHEHWDGLNLFGTFPSTNLGRDQATIESYWLALPLIEAGILLNRPDLAARGAAAFRGAVGMVDYTATGANGIFFPVPLSQGRGILRAGLDGTDRVEPSRAVFADGTAILGISAMLQRRFGAASFAPEGWPLAVEALEFVDGEWRNKLVRNPAPYRDSWIALDIRDEEGSRTVGSRPLPPAAALSTITVDRRSDGVYLVAIPGFIARELEAEGTFVHSSGERWEATPGQLGLEALVEDPSILRSGTVLFSGTVNGQDAYLNRRPVLIDPDLMSLDAIRQVWLRHGRLADQPAGGFEGVSTADDGSGEANLALTGVLATRPLLINSRSLVLEGVATGNVGIEIIDVFTRDDLLFLPGSAFESGETITLDLQELRGRIVSIRLIDEDSSGALQLSRIEFED